MPCKCMCCRHYPSEFTEEAEMSKEEAMYAVEFLQSAFTQPTLISAFPSMFGFGRIRYPKRVYVVKYEYRDDSYIDGNVKFIVTMVSSDLI